MTVPSTIIKNTKYAVSQCNSIKDFTVGESLKSSEARGAGLYDWPQSVLFAGEKFVRAISRSVTLPAGCCLSAVGSMKTCAGRGPEKTAAPRNTAGSPLLGRPRHTNVDVEVTGRFWKSSVGSVHTDMASRRCEHACVSPGDSAE